MVQTCIMEIHSIEFMTGGGEGPGFYDRLEVYYEPSFGQYLKLRVAALFHFHGMTFTGCSQVISLRFDLNGLLKNKKN